MLNVVFDLFFNNYTRLIVCLYLLETKKYNVYVFSFVLFIVIFCLIVLELN